MREQNGAAGGKVTWSGKRGFLLKEEVRVRVTEQGNFRVSKICMAHEHALGKYEVHLGYCCL